MRWPVKEDYPMETLDQLRRERRQSKLRKRVSWAKALRRPWTLKALLAIAPFLANLVRLGIEVGRIFKE
jgi:hypothetical protein